MECHTKVGQTQADDESGGFEFLFFQVSFLWFDFYFRLLGTFGVASSPKQPWIAWISQRKPRWTWIPWTLWPKKHRPLEPVQARRKGSRGKTSWGKVVAFTEKPVLIPGLRPLSGPGPRNEAVSFKT